MRTLLVVTTLLIGGTIAAGAEASPPNERPVLESFGAQFVPKLYGTIYTAHARDPEGKAVTVGFTFRAPANDPMCTRFAEDPDVTQRSGKSFTQRATWYHGDEHGCDHEREGPYGHDGFVTVRFSDAGWNCNATYRGSMTSRRSSRPHVFCSRIQRP